MSDPDDTWWITTHVIQRRDFEAGVQGAHSRHAVLVLLA